MDVLRQHYLKPLVIEKKTRRYHGTVMYE